MKHQIVETFVSIQGEGSLQGQNMLFIRWFGCNLKCPWCDEPKHVEKGLITLMHEDEIVELAVKSGVKWVCLTGGEISLHPLNLLIRKLQEAGLKVQAESNGLNILNISKADHLTCSPKDKDGNIPNGIIGHWTDIKLVVQRGDDARNHLKVYGDVCDNLFVQPCNNEDGINQDNLDYALELIQEFPKVGLSVQLHKILGVD